MDRHKTKRNPLLLFLGLTGIIGLSAYVNIVAPASLPAVLGFFALVAASLWLLLSYALVCKRHTLLITGGVLLFLFLRYVGLKHPLYAILLLASVFAAEFLWRERS